MRIYTLLFLSALSSQALAVSVSLDLNPVLLGIQNTADFDINETFDVAVVIDQVQSQSIIQSYEFDITFNSQVLEAQAVTKGNFLTGEFGENIDKKIDSNKVNFSLFAFGNSNHDLQGLLAIVTFKIKDRGESPVNLNKINLMGVGDNLIPSSIAVDAINNATVSSVPLPAALAMFTPALLSLVGLGIFRHTK